MVKCVDRPVDGIWCSFTAAYFDQTGLYAFERQPDAVAWNLAMLMRPFGCLVEEQGLISSFESFGDRYRLALRKAMLPRMGFEDRGTPACKALLASTFDVLRAQGCRYHGLFLALRDRLACVGLEEGGPKLPENLWPKASAKAQEAVQAWREAWWARWQAEPPGDEALPELRARLGAHNPRVIPYRPHIERVWGAIDSHDDWQPFYDWMAELKAPFQAPAGAADR